MRSFHIGRCVGHNIDISQLMYRWIQDCNKYLDEQWLSWWEQEHGSMRDVVEAEQHLCTLASSELT